MVSVMVAPLTTGMLFKVVALSDKNQCNVPNGWLNASNPSVCEATGET